MSIWIGKSGIDLSNYDLDLHVKCPDWNNNDMIIHYHRDIFVSNYVFNHDVYKPAKFPLENKNTRLYFKCPLCDKYHMIPYYYNTYINRPFENPNPSKRSIVFKTKKYIHEYENIACIIKRVIIGLIIIISAFIFNLSMFKRHPEGLNVLTSTIESIEESQGESDD